MIWIAVPLFCTLLFSLAGMAFYVRYEVTFAAVLAMLLPAGIVDLGAFLMAPPEVGLLRYALLWAAAIGLVGGLGGAASTRKQLAGRPLRARTTSVVTREP